MESTYKFVRFLMKPIRPKKEIFHFKFSRAITQSSTNQIIYELRRHIQQKPKVLMLSINCGSIAIYPQAFGSVTQCQILVDAFQQASINLNAPLYTFVEDYGLGAGYQLACAGHKIYAIPDPYSLIGDIGLNYTHVGFNQFIEKHQITYKLSGQECLLLDAFREVSQKQEQLLEKDLQLSLDILNNTIQKNRKNIANQHLIYNAQQAKELGFIDEVQTFEELQQQNYDNYKIRELTLYKDSQASILIKSQQNIWKSIESILMKLEVEQFDQGTLLNIDTIKQELIEHLTGLVNNINYRDYVHDLILEFMNQIMIQNINISQFQQ